MAYWSQNDFSGGINNRNFHAPNSLSYLSNGYLEQAGQIRKRGAKQTLGTVAAGTAIVTTSDNIIPGLAGSSYALVAQTSGANKLSSINVTSFAEVDLYSGLKWYNGSSWTTWAPEVPGGTGYYTVLSDEVLINNGSGIILRWYGGNVATYSTGTVAGSSGTPTLTGTGTSWTSSHEGMYFCTADSDPKVYRVLTVNSTTSITLDRNLSADLSGASYSIQPIAPVTTDNADLAHTGAQVNMLQVGGWSVAYHKGRMFFPDPDDPTVLRWSGTVVDIDADSAYVGVQYHHDEAKFGMDSSVIGTEIKAIIPLKDRVYVIGRNGISSLTGTVASDGTDLGAGESPVSHNIGIETVGEACSSPMGIFISGNSRLHILNDGEISPFGTDRLGDLTRGFPTFLSYPSPRLILMQGTTYCYEYDFNANYWTSQTFDTAHGLPSELGPSENQSLGLEDSGKVVDWTYDRFPDSGTGFIDGGGTSQPKLEVGTQYIQMNPDAGKFGRPKYAVVCADADTSLDVEVQVGAWGNPASSTLDDEYTSSFSSTVHSQRFPFSDVLTAPYALVWILNRSADDAVADETSIYTIGLEFEPSNEL